MYNLLEFVKMDVSIADIFFHKINEQVGSPYKRKINKNKGGKNCINDFVNEN